ncbi:DUF4232 domain-containing protein [Amycolatopsis sp. NPDC059027]|uniref:DUF4232 domain-containing protein n=1 Tax=Amycolatopsis sp. NPDC059027 TaxID=3346709 RepID=UPI00366EBFA8
MGITTKALRRGTMTVATVAAVGALGACSTGQPGNSAPAPAPQSGNGGGVGAAPNAGTGQGSAAKSTPAADGSGGSHPNCANLKVTDKTPDLVPGTTTQMRFQLLLTNQGSAPCVVRGFPGVRLDGADGSTWDLARTNADVTPVLLGHGEHATADLTYSTAAPITGGGSGSTDSGWHATTMTVTPPNSTNTQTLAWVDSVGLAKQDGATHPGTYVGPVHSAK